MAEPRPPFCVPVPPEKRHWLNSKARDIYDRRMEVAEALRHYMPNAKIVRMISEKWGCKDRVVHNDIKYVLNAWLAEHKKQDDSEQFARAIEARQDLAHDCIAAGDKQTAIRVMDSIAKLTGWIDRVSPRPDSIRVVFDRPQDEAAENDSGDSLAEDADE